MSAILEFQNLSVSYGKVRALNEVSGRVEAGTIVTVIGPNGAGKSTMLNALVGLLPSTGKVLFEGHDLAVMDTEARVEAGLCLVPEQRELFVSMSVEENLLLGAYVRHRNRDRTIRASLEDVFDRFPRLVERRRQLAGTLSGGERQMLALGRALMGKPKLLMLDEPSLGLAPLIVRQVFQIISDLRATGVSILLVEQNARAALQVADYGYVIETGNAILEGASNELAGNPRVLATYLGAVRQSSPQKVVLIN